MLPTGCQKMGITCSEKSCNSLMKPLTFLEHARLRNQLEEKE